MISHLLLPYIGAIIFGFLLVFYTTCVINLIFGIIFGSVINLYLLVIAVTVANGLMPYD